ncbi:penicillin acylase family protein [Neolewinella lacunae]|uniref:Penicillin acylase family protein n=1 Tax=Neolewinella lacunae TaxID=1517758 RepID=A0A923PLD0_9BACT|nr:penicillin acylase family protein [Neolewinella lacunae]MBC6993796.1 penicillin acylase family protein [Neolewinella lacunae]MDN3635313.1 penicillin acylase family protein [Neolewinella lacunae]
MKYYQLLLASFLLGAWLLIGSYPGLGGLPVPALGEFFNPATGFWRNTQPALSLRRGQRSIASAHPLAAGDIFFDDRGVPHIFAPTLENACFLQGYSHAADRLWQMDISTRATEGTLSEVLGQRTLERDRDQVRRGFRSAAQREIDTMRVHFPDDYRYLEAYAAGINAWIDQLQPRDYPVEYKLLGHQPLHWSPYRTALLMKGMSQSLSGYNVDAKTVKTRERLGAERYAELFPERFPGASPIVPDASGARPSAVPTLPVLPIPEVGDASAPGPTLPQRDFAGQPSPAPAAAPTTTSRSAYHAGSPQLNTLTDPHAVPEALPYTLLPPHPSNGSNNWAVSSEHSNTGYPLLASDPHLNLTLPSIWCEVQIHLPGVNARGVGLPGAPGIMIGFNDHVAYGETNVGHDVTDWFKITWTDSSRTHYLLDGAPTPATLVRDTLRVKGQAAEVIVTPYTIFGPVPYTEGPYADHAMRYLAQDAPGAGQRPHTIVGTFLGLMRATNYGDYEQALRGYVDPAQNFLFAAKDGDIAIRPNGFFPLRGTGNGTTPAAGDTRANNWRGYIPFEERPVHRNPTRGFVSSANQVTTGPYYPYPYTGNFDEYRGRYINRRLSDEPIFNQRTMKELQLSSYSLLAEELTPILIARINRKSLTPEGQALLRVISEWDYHYEGNSRAPTLFEAWRTKVYDLTFDEIPQDSGYVTPELWKWNALLRTQPDHPIFDVQASDNFVETGATLTQRAFDEILESLGGELPATWAETRASYVRHLGAIPGFGSGLITTGGGRHSPRALNGGNGASWRMVVELGPRPRAWGALPGGASGDPASIYYDFELDNWEHGRYHELVRWEDVTDAKNKANGHWAFGGD